LKISQPIMTKLSRGVGPELY